MLKNKALLIAVVFLVGVSLGIDQYVNKMLLAFSRPENAVEGVFEIGTYWQAFWMSVVTYGAVRGTIQWFVGGWWYNVRLEWCMTDLMVGHDKALGRRIYMMNQLIYAIPNIALHLALTILYANYFEWLEVSSVIRVAAMLITGACVLMTAVNSHRMVVANFEMDRKKALVWFLVLPLLMLSMQALGMAYVMNLV